MKRCAIAMLCVSVFALMLAMSPASATCGGAAGRAALTSGTPVTGDVDNGQTDKYTFTVPSGMNGYLAVQMINGDIDIEVCRSSNNQTMCYSHNSAGIMDGCHASEASIALPSPPWDPDTYVAEFGNALPPGTYRLDVKHCFSSVDGDGCDYVATDPFFGDPLAPGGLDAAPPVQYALLLQAR